MLATDLPSFSQTLHHLVEIDALISLRKREYKEYVLPCHHDDVVLTVRSKKNKKPGYCLQCTKCGCGFQKWGQPKYIKESLVSKEDKEFAVKWDYGIGCRRQSYLSKWVGNNILTLEHLAKKVRKCRDPDFYQQYIDSPEWAEKRIRILLRAGDWCEVCREQPAVQIHHKTYERLGNEIDDDLLAVCRDCHEDIHGRDLSLPPEKGLQWKKKQLLKIRQAIPEPVALEILFPDVRARVGRRGLLDPKDSR